MKKKVAIALALIVGIAIIIIAVLYSTDYIPRDEARGTIKKVKKYRKQQTKIGDISLSPDILKDTIKGKEIAINMAQLSFITEAIADQTENIISEIKESKINQDKKTELIGPLSEYQIMTKENTDLIRKSSNQILAYISDEIKSVTDDIDKNIQDIDGFFNRYKNNNDVFTKSINTIEKIIAESGSTDDISGHEIIRDKLYTVAFLNANFLDEKEIKKEIIGKIINELEIPPEAMSEDIEDDDIQVIVYNDKKSEFQILNKKTFQSVLSQDINSFNSFALQGSLAMLRNMGLSVVQSFKGCLARTDVGSTAGLESMNAVFLTAAQAFDLVAARSMALGSMAKYSGTFSANLSDLKSVLSQDELQSVLMSPYSSINLTAEEKLGVIMNTDELQSNELGVIIVPVGSIDKLGNQDISLSMSSLGVAIMNNQNIIGALNKASVNSILSYQGASEGLESVNIIGSFDQSLGVHPQVGLDFLQNSLGSTFLGNTTELNGGIFFSSSKLQSSPLQAL